MKHDVGYAIVAALSLSALTALWALIQAPDLADPDTQVQARGAGGSVPVRPRPPENDEAIERAVAVLATRDLFRAAAPADMATLQRLSTARIDPPVELIPVEPERTRPAPRFTAAPPPPAPVYRPPPPVETRPAAPPRPEAPRVVERPGPASPSAQQAVTMRDPRFPLTLRGVFPDPRTGGRAHVSLPNGRVVVTGPGGVIEGFQVMAINAASIVVQGRGGPPYRLEMPGY